MDEKNLFADFLARLRAHDQTAADQLVEVYGPVILRVVGRRLAQLGLSRDLDPEDIAQGILVKLFAELTKRFELDSFEDVMKLLTTMTRHEITDAYRHAH